MPNYAGNWRRGQDLSEVSKDALEKLLTRKFPEIKRLVSVERLSGGASQETYRITLQARAGQKHLCLRRAPGGFVDHAGDQRPGLDVEAALMRAARELGVPEPEIHYVLQSEDGLGEGFIMEWIDGEALGRRIVTSPELGQARKMFARQCGSLLAKIHSIDLISTGLDQRLARLPPRAFVEQTWEKYRLLEVPQPMLDFAARWLLQNLPEKHPMCLVHNDFRNGNLMVDSDGIRAVLDWETAHVGDPVRDLGWLCNPSWRFGGSLPVGGIGTREEFLNAYAAESGYEVEPGHLKFWEVFGSFWWSIACLGMAEHYRSGPDQTVERPAIGRRASEGQADCVNHLIPGHFEFLEPVSPDAGLDMPESGELLSSVHDFLRQDVMAETQGRLRFLSLVASNSLAILMRESGLLAQHRREEKERLQALLGTKASLQELRRTLCRALRDGDMPLGEPGLAIHLRQTVMNQLQIDQPKYPALKGVEDL